MHNYWDIIPFMEHKLDDTDRNILRHLQNDAAQSIDTLAEKVHLSRNACWRRVKLLEERKILTGRVATVDPVKVGLGLQVFCLLRAADHSPDWLKRFDRAVKNMPEITSAQRMSGDLDYVLRVHVADMAGYDTFYKRLISQVPLRDISASFVMESIKDSTAIPV
jgi:Lrp/AsnC family transcriptional regulator